MSRVNVAKDSGPFAICVYHITAKTLSIKTTELQELQIMNNYQKEILSEIISGLYLSIYNMCMPR